MRRRTLLSGVAAGALVSSGALAESTRLQASGRVLANLAVDGVNAMDAAHGVVADGRSGEFTADIGATSTLTMWKANVSITITGSTVTLAGLPTAGGFADADVGMPLWIQGAGPRGGDFVSTITGIVSDRSVTVATPPPTQLSAQSTKLLWPCFLAADVGKTILLNQGGANIPGVGWWSASPLLTTIAAYTGPNQVTLGTPMRANTKPGFNGLLVTWGTDNTTAIYKAGMAALAARKRTLFFPEPGRVCAFSVAQGNAVMLGNLTWIGGEKTTSFLCDRSGMRHPKNIVPWNAPAPPPPQKRLVARKHLKRTAAALSPVVVFIGDSMAPADAVAGPIGSSPMWEFFRQLQLQNPDKTFPMPVDLAIGGANWAWLDSAPPGPMCPGWYTDKPRAWLAYAAAAKPDLIVLAINGENDGSGCTYFAMASVIQKVLGFERDRNGHPPDIVMLNNRHHSYSADASATGQASREFPSMLYRSVASKHGFGFLDYEDRAILVRDGWSPVRLPLRSAAWPALGSNVGPNGPACVPYAVRDLAITFIVHGGNGSSAWAGVGGGFTFQIGNKPDNVLAFGYDRDNRLTLQANTWGKTVASTVALVSGAVTLASTGQGSASVTYTTSGNRLMINSGSLPGIAQGQCILLPAADYDGGALRTFVQAVSGDTIMLADVVDRPQARYTGTIYYGGMMFVAKDASASSDIVIEGAGASAGPLATRISGFTDFQHVTLAAKAGTDVSGSAGVFCGRISIPRITSAIVTNATSVGRPRISITVRADQLTVAYADDSIGANTDVYKGPVERFGGPYTPLITPFANGGNYNGFSTFYNMWIDDASSMLTMPVLTDEQIWGDAGSYSAFGGNAVNHLSGLAFEAIDVAVVSAQDLAT